MGCVGCAGLVPLAERGDVIRGGAGPLGGGGGGVSANAGVKKKVKKSKTQERKVLG